MGVWMFLNVPCHEILALWEWCGWARPRPRQVGKQPWQQCQGSWGRQLCETGAGRSPAARSSQGQGWDALITGYGIHRRKWLKAWEGMRWGNPEDLMDLVGDSHNSDSWQKSLHYIHCSLLTNRVTHSPTVGLNIHWNWLKNELGKSPSAQNVHMRQDKKLSATHSQPEDTGSTAQHLQPGAEDGLH